jgi:transcriptional regulator with XRE-family HTH domain
MASLIIGSRMRFTMKAGKSSVTVMVLSRDSMKPRAALNVRSSVAMCEKVAQALARAFGANPIYVFRLARILKTPSRSRNFSTWLVGELLLRKMSQEELGQKAGLPSEVVADLTRGVPPTFEIAEKLAYALDLDALYTQQLAGLIPPGEEALSDEEIELLSNYRDLSPAGRRVVQDIVRSMKEHLDR